jgi:hypothetical protein
VNVLGASRWRFTRGAAWALLILGAALLVQRITASDNQNLAQERSAARAAVMQLVEARCGGEVDLPNRVAIDTIVEGFFNRAVDDLCAEGEIWSATVVDEAVAGKTHLYAIRVAGEVTALFEVDVACTDSGGLTVVAFRSGEDVPVTL